jgi:hypothetical protein
MNIARTYEDFICLEERTAALYLELSVAFICVPELSWFWVDMAMDEKVQAGLLYRCREIGLFADTLPDEDQLTEFRILFDELEGVVRQGGLSVDDAFAVAERLERSTISDVCLSLTAAIPSRKKLHLSTERRMDALRHARQRFKA